MKHILTIFTVAFIAGCTTTAPQDETAISRMESIIVPEVDFRKGAMSDIIELVANSWHCVCHPWIHPTQEIDGDSVTYYFHVDEYDAHDPHTSIGLIKGTSKTSFVRLGPMVTFHATKINIHDLLTQLVEQVDGTLNIEGNAVTIKMRVEQPAPPLLNKSAETVDPFGG